MSFRPKMNTASRILQVLLSILVIGTALRADDGPTSIRLRPLSLDSVQNTVETLLADPRLQLTFGDERLVDR